MLPTPKSTCKKRTRAMSVEGAVKRVSGRTRKPTEKGLELYDENALTEVSPNLQQTRDSPAKKSDAKIGLTKEEFEQMFTDGFAGALAEVEKKWRDVLTTVMLKLDKQQTEAAKHIQEMQHVVEMQQTQIQQLTERVDEANAREEERATRTQPSTWAGMAAAAKEAGNNAHNIGMLHQRPVSVDLFCTVDTSKVEGTASRENMIGEIRKSIEEEMHQHGKDPKWKCKAVIPVHKIEGRCRVICRNENELEEVKKAAEKAMPQGGRILRDQLFPVKVDGASAHRIITLEGKIKEDAIQTLEEENNTKISKIVWLSNKALGKAYGSMAVFFKRGEEAVRFLNERFFTVGGESAGVSVFEVRKGPLRCYKCQDMGHRAFQCKNEVRCSNCAATGHDRQICHAAIPKCVKCGGPHSVSSGNCTQNER